MERRDQKGFTLIELMITVAIIGILAAVAVPSFLRNKISSRTAEAKVNLKAIATSQIAYQAEFDTFRACVANPSSGVPGVFKANWDTGTSYDDIGFSPKDTKVHYQYLVVAGGTGSLMTSFNATATGNLDGDGDNAVYEVTEVTPVRQTLATRGFY